MSDGRMYSIIVHIIVVTSCCRQSRMTDGGRLARARIVRRDVMDRRANEKMRWQDKYS